MKGSRPFLLLAILGIQPVMAQMNIPGVTPAHPGKFKTRAVGSSVDPGASVTQVEKANPNVRYVTHIILYEYRMWSSAEGKPLEAKLIAFEDLVTEAPKGEEPAMPKPPEHPTLTRDGKIRLLVNKKAVEVALDRLSQSDRDFIDQMKAALAKKAAKEK